jgi:hypothetical protein
MLFFKDGLRDVLKRYSPTEVKKEAQMDMKQQEKCY